MNDKSSLGGPDFQRLVNRNPIQVNFYAYDEYLTVEVMAGGENVTRGLELSWDEAPDISPTKLFGALSHRESTEVCHAILGGWMVERTRRNESKEAS